MKAELLWVEVRNLLNRIWHFPSEECTNKVAALLVDGTLESKIGEQVAYACRCDDETIRKGAKMLYLALQEIDLNWDEGDCERAGLDEDALRVVADICNAVDDYAERLARLTLEERLGHDEAWEILTDLDGEPEYLVIIGEALQSRDKEVRAGAMMLKQACVDDFACFQANDAEQRRWREMAENIVVLIK